MSEVREPLIIGAAEYVDFPEWGIRRLRAKVDTGARSSALHVENVRERRGAVVRFDVRLHRSDADARVRVEAKLSRRGPVTPSTGHPERRIFVEALVRIGPIERLVEVGLVDRSNMIYRMLLGRSAIQQAFLVDVTKRYALSQPSGLSRPAPRTKVAR